MGAHNELVLEGVAELREALRRLPEDLAQEAGVIVRSHAEDAFRQMDAIYAEHEWTGNLRRSLRMQVDVSRFGARAVIENRARHAYWAEHGTETRRHKSGKSVGSMPPILVFARIAPRVRRRLEAVLRALVEQAGLVVTER